MVPNEVLKGIKVRAAVAWPGDYSMQAHVIGEQSEAFERIAHYQTTLEADPKLITQNQCFAFNQSIEMPSWQTRSAAQTSDFVGFG